MILLVLHAASWYLIYFIPLGVCTSQSSSPILPLSSNPLSLETTRLFSVSVFCYVQLYVLFFRVRIQVKTEFVFLCLTYFTKHNIFQVHPCCCKWQNFLLFWLSGIPLCLFTAYLHPFISSWTLQLFPYLGYCKQCCGDHWGAYLSFQIISNGFCFLQMYTQLWNCWSIW